LPTPSPAPTTAAPTDSPTSSPTSLYDIFYESESLLNSLDDCTDIKSSAGGARNGAYIDMCGAGSFIEFPNVDGGATGGECVLAFRYASGSERTRPCDIRVNGNKIGTLSFPLTGAWDNWQMQTITTTCSPGTNTVRVTSVDTGPNIDYLAVMFTAPPTPPTPTIPMTNAPTVAATTPPPPTPTAFQTMFEAENAARDSCSQVKNQYSGATNGKYVDMCGAGSWVEFSNVNGDLGSCTLSIRYSHGSSNTAPRPCQLSVNGAIVGSFNFVSTGGWDQWQTESITTTCQSGGNVVRVAAVDNGGPNLDHLSVIFS